MRRGLDCGISEELAARVTENNNGTASWHGGYRGPAGGTAQLQHQEKSQKDGDSIVL